PFKDKFSNFYSFLNEKSKIGIFVNYENIPLNEKTLTCNKKIFFQLHNKKKTVFCIEKFKNEIVYVKKIKADKTLVWKYSFKPSKTISKNELDNFFNYWILE
ncbi:MAG: hypothetical protein KDD45_11910, partial [Bdellovibrionales bacterium]|nr:hypothetical protein [Bdellovibrionales bacterium]